VPPLKGQYQPLPPMVGAPMGLAGNTTLPPLPMTDVPEADPYASPPISGAVRKPLSLTAPQPLTMQPPVADTVADYPSPFIAPDAPVTPLPTTDAGKPSMESGRRSGPLLTGY